MAETDERNSSVSSNMYGIDANDPDSRMIDRSGMHADDIAQISALMAALGRLRDAEQALSEASQRYMKLGRTDMRALHYLIVAQHSGEVVTPSAIATHLGISSASTTKLLDRLEAAEHIVRSPHPTDRRALAISISDHTREAAIDTVGRLQAKRFQAAARLSPAEREVVIGFLDDMSKQISIGSVRWANAAAETDDSADH
jgi:DNA-binding MarR family transcriptional regulator